MTTLTFPSITPNRTKWGLRSNTGAFVSPLSRATQTGEYPGAAWVATLTFDNLSEADARTLAAFLAQLRGASGRFYLYDHAWQTPRGSAPGSPVVSGAGQTGASLVTSGWTPSQSGILLPGDYIGVNDELKMVTATEDSDGAGGCTVNFEPPLRNSPSDGATITVTRPTAIMRLLDDDQASWANVPMPFSSFVLTCEEAFA